MRPVDGKVRIDFADTGKGIREEHIAKIFTPFFTTNDMGTGLGLSVVHNIIAAHHGEITVAGKEGKGALFSIFLPSADSLSDQNLN